MMFICLKSLAERFAGTCGAMSAAHPAKLSISHWTGLCLKAEHCPAHDNLQASGRLRMRRAKAMSMCGCSLIQTTVSISPLTDGIADDQPKHETGEELTDDRRNDKGEDDPR
jgi:hypothetical protein